MLEIFKQRVDALKAGAPLKVSNGMKFARTELVKSRELRDAAAAEALRTANAYNAPYSTTSIEDVRAAEKRQEDAERRYKTARQSLVDAQKAYGQRFLDGIGPMTVEARSVVSELAELLAKAIEPSVAAESFAVGNGLPINRFTSRARRIRDLARSLKDMAE